MTICPCGCGRLIPVHSETGRRQRSDTRYASATCAQRARRRTRQRGVVVTAEDRRRWGREGGKTQALGRILRLLSELAHLDRDAAILEAYRRGQYAFYRIPKAERAA
jgi:hypothetical protein